MLAQLERLGIEGQTCLEIGCGVGALHQTLLEHGASRAVGIDIAPRMLELAVARAKTHELESRTEYRLGDFVELCNEVEAADITLLDKVVCCYPAPRELLSAAGERTRKVIALTYPRKHRFAEVWNWIWNLGFWVMGSDFRGFVHDPALVRREIEKHGLRRVWEHQSFLWLTEVYCLDAA